MSLWSRLRAPVFNNTGSTARDHLASERTFLSWLRTGLGFVALGIAVERFSQLPEPDAFYSQSVPGAVTLEHAPESKTAAQQEKEAIDRELQKLKDREQVLVAVLLGTGTGSVAYGVTRYFQNLRLLQQGLYRPAYFGAALFGASVAGLAGAAYWATIRDQKNKIAGMNN